MFRVTQRPFSSHMPVIAQRICFLDLTQACDETPDLSSDTGMNPPLEAYQTSPARFWKPSIEVLNLLLIREISLVQVGEHLLSRVPPVCDACTLWFFAAVLQGRGGAVSNSLTPVGKKKFSSAAN